MPNLAEHPAEAVKIPIGGHEYKFRITLGSMEQLQMDSEVPSSQEEAEEQLEAARAKGSISGLLDTLWLARQPYRQEGETREALAAAIGPEDTKAVMAGFLRLHNRQLDEKKAEEIAEEANSAAKKKVTEKSRAAQEKSAGSKDS